MSFAAGAPSARRTRRHGPAGAGARSNAADAARGMVFSRVEGENVVARASTRVSFPTYSPRRACTRSPDRGGRCYRAYRIVAAVGVPGQYDGIQGRSWKSPPILDNPSTTTRMRRRTYELFYDGARL